MIPRFITQALSDEPLTIHGDGHASRDWLYVDDDAEAIESIIAADDQVVGEVINVATGIDITVSDIADKVLELLGKPVVPQGARRRAARAGRPPYRLDREGGEAPRLEGANVVRGRARAHHLVVPRQ